ncbi:MAG: hypothetical protein K1X88_24900 [Nannocystaceae bacterium]|nr:hypothetical protein [Nannocystaceae bacterium]
MTDGTLTGATFTSGDTDPTGGDSCADACSAYALSPDCVALGFSADACNQGCSLGGACSTCIIDSVACGTDCDSACATDPTTGGTDTGSPPQPCDFENTCGEAANCVTCDDLDPDGYCAPKPVTECTDDLECPLGEICGYLIGLGGNACGPAEAC